MADLLFAVDQVLECTPHPSPLLSSQQPLSQPCAQHISCGLGVALQLQVRLNRPISGVDKTITAIHIPVHMCSGMGFDCFIEAWVMSQVDLVTALQEPSNRCCRGHKVKAGSRCDTGAF